MGRLHNEGQNRQHHSHRPCNSGVTRGCPPATVNTRLWQLMFFTIQLYECGPFCCAACSFENAAVFYVCVSSSTRSCISLHRRGRQTDLVIAELEFSHTCRHMQPRTISMLFFCPPSNWGACLNSKTQRILVVHHASPRW